jgi:alpha-mannosidase
VVMFHEHTWGAWNSTSDPDNTFVIRQWEYKKRFGDSAVYYTGLMEKTLNVNGGNTNRITVVNTLPWVRSGYVEFRCPENFRGNTLRDENGTEVITQSLKNGYLVFAATGVPAKGEKQYSLVNEPQSIKYDGGIDYGVHIDSSSGAINRYREWVDTMVFKGLGQALYVSGLDPGK